jgi:hypothetical protein
MLAGRHEVSRALHGALRLARLDPAGMAFFDRSVAGFWRSFTAGLLVYPAFLILLGLRIEDAEWASSGVVRILLIETIGYVIAWVSFPLIMLPVARFLGREASWLDFIVAYNWSQVLQNILSLVSTLLIGSGMFSAPLVHGIAATAIVAALLYDWSVARISLDTSAAGATMVVLVDLVLSELIYYVTDRLH